MIDNWVDSSSVRKNDGQQFNLSEFEKNIDFIYWAVVTINYVVDEYDLFGEALSLFDEDAAQAKEYSNCLNANNEINASLERLMSPEMQNLYQEGYSYVAKWLPKITKEIELIVAEEPDSNVTDNELHKAWSAVVAASHNLSESMENLNIKMTPFTVIALVLSFCQVVCHISKWQEGQNRHHHLIDGINAHDLLNMSQPCINEILCIALTLHGFEINLIIMSSDYSINFSKTLSKIRAELSELGRRSSDISMIISLGMMESFHTQHSGLIKSLDKE